MRNHNIFGIICYSLAVRSQMYAQSRSKVQHAHIIFSLFDISEYRLCGKYFATCSGKKYELDMLSFLQFSLLESSTKFPRMVDVGSVEQTYISGGTFLGKQFGAENVSEKENYI